MLFLDGLDEVRETSSMSLYGIFNKFIQSQYTNNNLIVVTTRPNALKAKYYSYQVQEMEILPFDSTQIKQFVYYYYGHHSNAYKFLEDLRSQLPLREFSSNTTYPWFSFTNVYQTY